MEFCHAARLCLGGRISYASGLIRPAPQIDHDCVIGDYAFIAPGAVLVGNVTVREAGFVGANATVLGGRIIGVNAIVGAGAVVTRDVPDNAIVAGNPARLLHMKREAGTEMETV